MKVENLEKFKCFADKEKNMTIEYIDRLNKDGDSCIEYSMIGYNVNAEIRENVTGSFEITGNKPFLYENHEFLHSFYIDSNLTKIVFSLKKGFDAWDYQYKISLELERICFNLITYDNIHTFQPVCILSKMKTTQRQPIFSDNLALSDKLACKVKIKSESFYVEILNKSNSVLNPQKYDLYKSIYACLQCPDIAIQYMALYEILNSLLPIVDKRKTQKDVTTFFLNNKNKYKISFLTSRKKNKGNEDYFTYLRNQIGHPRGLSSEKIKKLGIKEATIKCLLRIINDVICEDCNLQ